MSETSRQLSLLAITVILGLFISGCSHTQTDPRHSEDTVTELSETASIAPEEPSDQPSTELMGPVETYLAWLEASREPEASVACGYLTDELQERMLDEFAATYGADEVSTCEDLTVMTAQMYAAFQQSDEVDVQILEHNEETATLFVTYVDTGECGTIAMHRIPAGVWMINAMSEACV